MSGAAPLNINRPRSTPTPGVQQRSQDPPPPTRESPIRPPSSRRNPPPPHSPGAAALAAPLTTATATATTPPSSAARRGAHTRSPSPPSSYLPRPPRDLSPARRGSLGGSCADTESGNDDCYDEDDEARLPLDQRTSGRHYDYDNDDGIDWLMKPSPCRDIAYADPGDDDGGGGEDGDGDGDGDGDEEAFLTSDEVTVPGRRGGGGTMTKKTEGGAGGTAPAPKERDDPVYNVLMAPEDSSEESSSEVQVGSVWCGSAPQRNSCYATLPNQESPHKQSHPLREQTLETATDQTQKDTAKLEPQMSQSPPEKKPPSAVGEQYIHKDFSAQKDIDKDDVKHSLSSVQPPLPKKPRISTSCTPKCGSVTSHPQPQRSPINPEEGKKPCQKSLLLAEDKIQWFCRQFKCDRPGFLKILTTCNSSEEVLQKLQRRGPGNVGTSSKPPEPPPVEKQDSDGMDKVAQPEVHKTELKESTTEAPGISDLDPSTEATSPSTMEPPLKVYCDSVSNCVPDDFADVCASSSDDGDAVPSNDVITLSDDSDCADNTHNKTSIHTVSSIPPIVKLHTIPAAKPPTSTASRNVTEEERHKMCATSKEPLILSELGEPIIKVPDTLAFQLMNYQRDGVRFLYSLYTKNIGGILADDMGLGKTIQTIAFISSLASEQSSAFLLVVPASMLENWSQEFKKISNVVVKVLYNFLTFYEALLNTAKRGRVKVLLASYETFKLNLDELNTINWNCIIFDEVHKIKNKDTTLTKVCKSIASPRRYGLTGTVMQNSFEELWTLIDFTNPGYLGSLDEFRRNFVAPIKTGQRRNATPYEVNRARMCSKELGARLHKIILRRDKSIIQEKLPGKEDNVVFCKLTEVQTRCYRRALESPVLDRIRRHVVKCHCGSNKPANSCPCQGLRDSLAPQENDWKTEVLRAITLLQKTASHPSLLYAKAGQAEEKQIRDKEFQKVAFGTDAEFINKCHECADFALICGKLRVLQCLLRKWKEARTKAGNFTKFVC
ncbi:Switch 2 protein [Pelomyxa schiedti]|nr:Switch 2 protein [Pelomyxa schiedti]